MVNTRAFRLQPVCTIKPEYSRELHENYITVSTGYVVLNHRAVSVVKGRGVSKGFF